LEPFYCRFLSSYLSSFLSSKIKSFSDKLENEMSHKNPFGGQSSAEVLRWISLYKKLDAKRSSGNLSPEEAKNYEEICNKLAHLLDPESRKNSQKRKDLRVSTKHEIR